MPAAYPRLASSPSRAAAADDVGQDLVIEVDERERRATRSEQAAEHLHCQPNRHATAADSTAVANSTTDITEILPCRPRTSAGRHSSGRYVVLWLDAACRMPGSAKAES